MTAGRETKKRQHGHQTLDCLVSGRAREQQCPPPPNQEALVPTLCWHTRFQCFISLATLPSDAKISQTQGWTIHASLAPSFAKMMSKPLQWECCISWLLPRPSVQQPKIVQHPLSPSRVTVHRVQKRLVMGRGGDYKQLLLFSFPSLSPKTHVSENLLCARHRFDFKCFL